MNKLAEALKKKYSSPKVALRVLGLDPALLDEGDDKMTNQFNKQAYNQAYQAALTAARKMIAMDEETESSGNIEERLRRLESLFEDLMSADALHRFGGGRDSDLYEDLGQSAENGWIPTGDRRRGARDEPEPFPGRPRPGGGMDPQERERQQEWDRKAADRRRRGLGADSMYGLGPRPTSALESKTFHAMFPQAKRIGYLG